MKKLFLIFIFLVFFCMLVIYPETCINSAKNALQSWLYIVVPSMLPFFMASSILSDTGIVKLIATLLEPLSQKVFKLSGYFIYAFLAAAVSGYPMGAKISAELYSNGYIDERTASIIIKCTSVSGPVFIIGAVSVGMLGVKNLSAYILLPHYLSAIALAVIFAIFGKHSPHSSFSLKNGVYDFLYNNPFYKKNIGAVLSGAVTSSINTILLVGGFIILFSVILGMLQELGILSVFPSETANCVLAGFLEMTNGCLTTASSNIELYHKISLISGTISFAGLSVHAQTYAIAENSGISIKGFFPSKLAQAAISYFITFAMLSIFKPSIATFSITYAKHALNTYPILGIAAFVISFSFAVIIKRIIRPGYRC